RRRHTRCYRDWSSDVCSSDLMSDPVEEDTFPVDGIQMSNFVHPAWFEPFKHPPGTKYDHLGLVAKPYGMTKGGYVIIKKKGKVKIGRASCREGGKTQEVAVER